MVVQKKEICDYNLDVTKVNNVSISVRNKMRNRLLGHKFQLEAALVMQWYSQNLSFSSTVFGQAMINTQ